MLLCLPVSSLSPLIVSPASLTLLVFLLLIADHSLFAFCCMPIIFTQEHRSSRLLCGCFNQLYYMRAEILRFIDVLQEDTCVSVFLWMCSLCARVYVVCMHVYRLLHYISSSK